MIDAAHPTLDTLRALAREAAGSAYVPYSGRPAAAVLLLSDGSWIPGVRVESASFSLVIPALLNAVTTALAAARTDVAAVAADHPLGGAERAFLEAAPFEGLAPTGTDAFAVTDLPEVSARFDPFVASPPPASPEDGIRAARQAAGQAYVPASDFPVGCVLVSPDGRMIPGANVEHEDWSRILCAERNALGTAVSYGHRTFETLYLSCLNDPTGTPCGACRQLLLELAPDAELWMDRGTDAPSMTRAADLLPYSFTGRTLARRRRG